MDKGKRVFLPWRCFFPFMNETAAPSFPSSFSRYRAGRRAPAGCLPARAWGRGLVRKNASLKKLLPLFRLCRHFPEFREAGQGTFLLHGRFSLDQGKSVINERLFHAIAAGVDPFAGNKFFHIGHFFQTYQFSLAGINAVLRDSLKASLFPPRPGRGGSPGGFPRHIRFIDIRLGGDMGGAALEE